jgi:hypothetical protein
MSSAVTNCILDLYENSLQLTVFRDTSRTGWNVETLDGFTATILMRLLIRRNGFSYELDETHVIKTLILHCAPTEDAVAVIFHVFATSHCLEKIHLYGDGIYDANTINPLLCVLGVGEQLDETTRRPHCIAFENFTFADNCAVTEWLVRFMVDLESTNDLDKLDFLDCRMGSQVIVELMANMKHMIHLRGFAIGRGRARYHDCLDDSTMADILYCLQVNCRYLVNLVLDGVVIGAMSRRLVKQIVGTGGHLVRHFHCNDAEFCTSLHPYLERNRMYHLYTSHFMWTEPALATIGSMLLELYRPNTTKE